MGFQAAALGRCSSSRGLIHHQNKQFRQPEKHFFQAA
jgi:hypothetical protein